MEHLTVVFGVEMNTDTMQTLIESIDPNTIKQCFCFNGQMRVIECTFSWRRDSPVALVEFHFKIHEPNKRLSGYVWQEVRTQYELEKAFTMFNFEFYGDTPIRWSEIK